MNDAGGGAWGTRGPLRGFLPGPNPLGGAAMPSDQLPRRFARIPTAAVTDVMDELGLLRQTLPAAIRPLAPDMRAAGYAFTARGRARRGAPRERDATLRQFLT